MGGGREMVAWKREVEGERVGEDNGWGWRMSGGGRVGGGDKQR